MIPQLQKKNVWCILNYFTQIYEYKLTAKKYIILLQNHIIACFPAKMKKMDYKWEVIAVYQFTIDSWTWMLQKCKRNIKFSWVLQWKSLSMHPTNICFCVLRWLEIISWMLCYLKSSLCTLIKYLLNNHIFICRHSYECYWNLSSAFILSTMFNSNMWLWIT